MTLIASLSSLPARRHVLAAALWWGAAACAVLSVACPQAASAGELRALPSFTALDLRTLALVEVRLGEPQRVEVEADPAVAAGVDTQVANGALVVRDREALSLSPTPPVRITIVVRRIDAVTVSGATRLRLDRPGADDLSLVVSGSSAVEANRLDTKRLRVQAGGSSSLTLSGRTGELALALGGSSSADASALEAKSVSLSGAGSSHAKVWAREALSASLSGASSARYHGRPTVSLSSSGVSRLDRLDETPPAR
jgi:hypothetical protein